MLFNTYLKKTKKNEHTLTFFASGWLYYETQLLIKFAQELKIKKRELDKIKINLIDPCYIPTLKGNNSPKSQAYLRAIKQFTRFAQHLLPGLEKFYIHPNVESYQMKIKQNSYDRTDIILAFDFGEIAPLKIGCCLALAYLKKLCTHKEFAILSFPHPQSEAHIQLIQNEPITEEQECEIKKLYTELSAIDLTDPNAKWPQDKCNIYSERVVIKLSSIAVAFPFPKVRIDARKRQLLTIVGFFVSSFLLLNKKSI